MLTIPPEHKALSDAFSRRPTLRSVDGTRLSRPQTVSGNDGVSKPVSKPAMKALALSCGATISSTTTVSPLKYADVPDQAESAGPSRS